MEKKVYRSELSPVSFLERSASVFPDKTAIVHGERRYTYREFSKRVYRLASALRRRGLQKHDRVGFLCFNTPHLLEAHFAVDAAADKRRGQHGEVGVDSLRIAQPLPVEQVWIAADAALRAGRGTDAGGDSEREQERAAGQYAVKAT